MYIRISLISFCSAPLDSVYLVGALEEALNIRGFRYHPSDIEATVVRCHKNIISRCVNLLQVLCC